MNRYENTFVWVSRHCFKYFDKGGVGLKLKNINIVQNTPVGNTRGCIGF